METLGLLGGVVVGLAAAVGLVVLWVKKNAPRS